MFLYILTVSGPRIVRCNDQWPGAQTRGHGESERVLLRA